jgi:hypothetical protein
VRPNKREARDAELFRGEVPNENGQIFRRETDHALAIQQDTFALQDRSLDLAADPSQYSSVPIQTVVIFNFNAPQSDTSTPARYLQRAIRRRTPVSSLMALSNKS